MVWDINGKMTKKLLQKTSRVYLLFALMLLIISAPIFYLLIQKLYLDDADEALLLRKEEFLKYSLPKIKERDVPVWNKFNRDIKIKVFNNNAKKLLFDTFYFDSLNNENEPYRELNYPISIEGKQFTYSARINLVETEDLIGNIILLFSIILIVLLIGMVLISRKMSKGIWKPFYDTLRQIELFDIDKTFNPQFPDTDVEEFDRLNHAIELLVERNLSIYQNQTEFIENAAHELQTPLAVIQAKLDSLIQDSMITKEQSEMLSSINDSISRLNRLNKNLLLLSRIENNIFKEVELVDVGEFLQKNADFFSEQADSKNIQIFSDLNEPISIHANKILTEVLISNLMLNAIRHNVENGVIRISLSKQQLSISNSGKATSLSKEKLFNRFSKQNPSEQGTGLGLALVKKIADLHSWEISYAFQDQLHYFTVHFN